MEIIYFYFYTIIFLLFYYIHCTKISESLQCLNVNKYDDLQHGIKVIGDKQKCFDVSKQCCFINITYYYGDFLLKHEFCNYLNVNITEFQQFLYNMYNDEQMFYANFTAHNYDMYRTIGRNLEENVTTRFNCFIGPKTCKNYSTYVVNNCQEFVDGVCTGVKNDTQFKEFVSKFHANYTEAYCGKKEEGNKCIKYDGSRANDKMVKPLLDELADHLQADNDEYVINDNESNVDINPDEEDESDGEDKYLEAWKDDNGTIIKNCSEMPKVKVTVECPDGYEYQEFINIKLIKLLLFIFFILF